MNTVTVLDLQMQALLDRLDREQTARTRRARDEATTQARDIVRHARAEARARLHEAVQETRREHAVALQRRRAALATRRRQQHQARLRRWLDDAWQRLPAALEARWNDRAQREAWCRAACQQALRSLVHTSPLVVRIDARWRDDVRPVIEQYLQATVGCTLEIVPVDGLGAGIIVRGSHALVDATLPGLLAARESITAALLAEVEATSGSDRSETP